MKQTIKTIIYPVISSLTLALFVAVGFSLPVVAQPLEIEKSEMRGQEATSGFVDENGKPLSQAEYEARNDELEKNILQKYPVVGYAIGGAAIGLVVWLAINKTNVIKK